MSRRRSKTKKPTATSLNTESAGTTARRTQEVFGILTLTSALLVGPSLASVHFGTGSWMGPFGQLVGTLLHWALGVGGYAVVGIIVLIALRIFATAIGATRTSLRSGLGLWRKVIGLLLATVSLSMLADLIAQPALLADASYGGAVGQGGVAMLTALVSRPGAWVIVITAVALSVVLATDLSWIRVALGLFAALRRGASEIGSAFCRLPARISTAAQWIAQQLAYVHQRQQQIAKSADGTAALPPVLRVDLFSAPQPESRPQSKSRTAKKVPAKQPVQKPAPMPKDLQISKPEAKSEPPLKIEPPKINNPQTATPEITAKQAGSKSPDPTPPKISKPAIQSADKNDPSSLTIVRSSFDKDKASDSAESKPAKAEKPVSRHGAGYVLNKKVYRLPSLNLLKIHGEKEVTIDEKAIQEQAARLTQTLSDYKIFGKVTEVHPGPVVTMYEFVPAPGTRVSKVAGLSNDLAMSLHAERVRIVAPIPGKGAIGIEVPNDKREVVSFKEIVGDEAFHSDKRGGRLRLALGKSIVGAPVVMDLAKMPHLLVAGATGAGKSVSVNSMICSLLLRYTPEEVRMILIDPKFLELSGYNDIPHLLLPVVTDPKQASVALRWAVAEMERRYQLLAEMRVRDISSFNRKVDRMRNSVDDNMTQEELPFSNATKSNSLTEASAVQVTRVNTASDGSTSVEVCESDGSQASQDNNGSTATTSNAVNNRNKKKHCKEAQEHLPYLVVVIDEFADLMMVAAKDVETSVARLAQKARACGIHLIVATQRPSVDVITGLIKANFPSRVAFQVASNHDSKTILGSYGAENLLGAGDMLVLDRGAEMRRVHGAYISDEEIEGIIEHVCEQGRPVYDMDILKAQEEEEAAANAAKSDEPVDALYDEAVALVAESQQASISMVQRRLRIGYNRAARLVEQMEREGIVGPSDGVRGREVLVQSHG